MMGYIHRDIKPENVCIDDEGNCKIIDFGISKSFTIGKKFKSSIGTPFYMAPEVANNQKYNQLTDVWGLGIIMFMIITGKSPYNGQKNNLIIEKVRKGAYNKDILKNENYS